jgi:hypothetical protein
MQIDRSKEGRFGALIFSVCLGIGVFIARALTSGPPYFADGPRHLRAIANHTYVIQPPGYWLFNRIAGFFPDAAHGILAMNWCFSAFGCVLFYACARRLVRSPLAELGAVLYATVFFAWFSGNVHSTYASQLFFAPLTFYFMLRFLEDKRIVWVLAVAASYAIGAGFRPSDGMFLAPLLLLFALKLPRKQLLLLGTLVVVLCAAWVIPNQIALHRYQPMSTGGEVSGAASGAIALGRINLYSVSNAIRFFLPLVIALGPAAIFLFRGRGPLVPWLWVWVLPGTAFFLLVYISDATYMDFMLGGLILLCLLGMSAARNTRTAAVVLTCSILINVAVYAGFRRLPLHNGAYLLVEKDVGNYSLYGVRHQFEVNRLPVQALKIK